MVALSDQLFIPMRKVLYLTRNGLLEPLGQSQILSYLKGISSFCRIALISFEKPGDRANLSLVNSINDICATYGICWTPLRFRANLRPWVSALSILQLLLVALWQFRSNRRPMLVHARSYLPAAIALILLRITGTPFIFDMRALWPEELISAGHLRRGSILHRSLLWIERQCLQECFAVVSLTHAAVLYLQKRYSNELALKRIVVIPTCADLQRFSPCSSTCDVPLVIGCVGTVLSGWFLTDWLSSFFDAVLRVVPTARFELISRDPQDRIRTALNHSACSWFDRLLIQSAAPAEMPSIIQRHTASVMFFTSGLSKLGSSPTRMAEVLGCGRPVVANPGVGDMEQVIRKHRVGVLANGPSAEEMDACVTELLALLNDPMLAIRCRRTAEALFSLESGTAAYLQLYTEILA